MAEQTELFRTTMTTSLKDSASEDLDFGIRPLRNNRVFNTHTIAARYSIWGTPADSAGASTDPPKLWQGLVKPIVHVVGRDNAGSPVWEKYEWNKLLRRTADDPTFNRTDRSY